MRPVGGFAFASTNQIIRSVRHSSCLRLDMAKTSPTGVLPSVLAISCRPQSQPSVMSGDVGVLVAVIVQCMKSSALASDLNSLMDQLVHVLVITHNTFPPTLLAFQPSIHPSIHPSIRTLVHPSARWPRPPPFDVWCEICQDGHWALFQFACSFSLSVSMLANLQTEWLSVAFVLGSFPISVSCASWAAISSFLDTLWPLIYCQLIKLKCHNSRGDLCELSTELQLSIKEQW